jgi:hypothetical protein
MALPDRVRATLLAFLHLSQDDSERMSADLAVGQGEEVHLVLAASSREAACDVS